MEEKIWNIVIDQFRKLIERQCISHYEGMIDSLKLCALLHIFIRALGINKGSQEDKKGKQGNYNVNSKTSL